MWKGNKEKKVQGQPWKRAAHELRLKSLCK